MLSVVAGHTGTESKTSQRRNAPRVLFSVAFTLQHLVPGVGIRPARGFSLDISGSGMGAIVAGSLRVGEAVLIEIPTGITTLATSAIVRHTSGARSGFEFLALRDEEREKLLQMSGTA